MITLEQAKNLKVGDIVYHRNVLTKRGEPIKWRVSGQVKTWKKNAFRVKVPVKHGLYDFGYIEQWVSPYNESIHTSNFDSFTLDINDILN